MSTGYRRAPVKSFGRPRGSGVDAFIDMIRYVGAERDGRAILWAGGGPMRASVLSSLFICLVVGCGSSGGGGGGSGASSGAAGTHGAGGTHGSGGSVGTSGASGSAGSKGSGGSHGAGGTTGSGGASGSGGTHGDGGGNEDAGPACGTPTDGGGRALGPCPGTQTCCPGNLPDDYYCKALDGGMCPALP